MEKDIWHYARTDFAKQVLNMFEIGLSSALTFFAPRRMGKTEFLRKDIVPLAEKSGWKTFYFSFLDVGPNVQDDFTQALVKFAEQKSITTKARKLLKRVSKISGEAVGIKADIELRESKEIKNDMKDIVAHLALCGKVLLLLDEVQILAKNKCNEQFVAGLRTALDINKDKIKVIFTGSSREGLRLMFSQANAPFFHFGQNLPFPELGKDFTDHLANIYKKVTGRNLDHERLWEMFQSMEKVPQLIRALVERIALNPNFTIKEAKDMILSDLADDREYYIIWNNCSTLEKLILYEIAIDGKGLFSAGTKKKLSKNSGITKLSIPTIQSTIRVLQRKHLIGRLLERRGYLIDDPNFRNWLLRIVPASGVNNSLPSNR